MAERLSVEQKHELKNRLRDVTRKLVEIAGEMGIHPGTAGYWAKKWNLPRRRAKRKKKDLRAVTRFDMSSEQAKALARRMIFATTSKRAFVAANPAIFGVARMWEIFTEMADHPSEP